MKLVQSSDCTGHLWSVSPLCFLTPRNLEIELQFKNSIWSQPYHTPINPSTPKEQKTRCRELLGELLQLGMILNLGKLRTELLKDAFTRHGMWMHFQIWRLTLQIVWKNSSRRILGHGNSGSVTGWSQSLAIEAPQRWRIQCMNWSSHYMHFHMSVSVYICSGLSQSKIVQALGTPWTSSTLTQ